MPINAELVAACLAPISPDAPAGAELRYDARLDEIKEARREEDLPGSERKLADWNMVIARCSTLLQKETKDLQLAAWLTEALLRRQGFAGLLTGVSVVHGLLDQFWDTVYPLPEDGDLEMRVAPVEWVGGKLLLPIRLAPCLGRLSCADLDAARAVPSEAEAKGDNNKLEIRTQAIDAGRSTPEDVEAESANISKAMLRTGLADLAACLAELQSLEKLGDEKFGQDAPSFNSLRTALDEPRRVLQQLLTQKLLDDPDPVEEITEDAGESGQSAPADPDAPLTPEPVSAADAAQRVAVVARWLRQQNKANPAPYLMLRAYRWGELLATAPDVEPRLLEAPPTVVRTRLRSLMLDGKWAELLEAAESLMATPAGRGWLDLQRYALTACSNLGAEYDAVAGGMRSELRALLRAVPQLPRMTLMDETPTANDATREWIAQEITAHNAAEGTGANGNDTALDATPSDGSELLETALQEDAATAQLGGLAKARAVHPSAARSGRDVFAAARAELAQNRPQRAIELLMAELTRDQSPRGRFLRQTQIAYIMVEAGLTHVAQPLLQQLVEQIDAQNLDQWESGPLVAQPLALLHRVLVKSGADPSQQETLYLRVCRLDPIQAMTLQAP